MGKRKSALTRAKEITSRTSFSKILPDYTLSSLQLFEVEKIIQHYMSINVDNHGPISRIAVIIKEGHNNIYDICMKLDHCIPHTREYFETLYKNGAELYNSRCENLSEKLTVSDFSVSLAKFLNRSVIIAKHGTLILTDKKTNELKIFASKYRLMSIKDGDADILCDIIKYHKDNYINRYETCKNASFYTDLHLTSRFTADKIKNIKKSRTDNAKIHFPSCVEYWINLGHTELESIDLVSKHQAKQSKKRTTYISPRSYSYWENLGYNDDDIREILKSIQSRTKESFISNYGEDEGVFKYDSMLQIRADTYYSKPIEQQNAIKKSKGRTKEQLILERGLDEANAIIASRCNSIQNSEANIFFRIIDEKNNVLLTESVTGYKTNEYWIKHDTGMYFVDYKYKNKIIEYYGSYWHCDERTFPNPTDIHPTYKEPVSIKREQDKERINYIKKQGYDVLIIWATDVALDAHKSINQCLNFLLTEDNT